MAVNHCIIQCAGRVLEVLAKWIQVGFVSQFGPNQLIDVPNPNGRKVGQYKIFPQHSILYTPRASSLISPVGNLS